MSYHAHGASPYQVGQAAALRFDKTPHGSDRQMLNDIIHSDEEKRRNGSLNPRFDATKSHDPVAEAQLKYLQRKYN